MIREYPEADFTGWGATNPVHYYVLDVLDLLQDFKDEDFKDEWAQDFVNVGKNSYMKMASKWNTAVIVPDETIVLPNVNVLLKFTDEGIFIGKIGANNVFKLKDQKMYEREIRARAYENAGEEWPNDKPLIFYQKSKFI